MPILIPAEPTFANHTEQVVWEKLRDQLGDDDLLIANRRLTDRRKDHEADLIVGFAGAGVVVVEIKGSTVWIEDDQWFQQWHGKPKKIDPVDQARTSKFAFRDWVCDHPQWGRRSHIRWAHAVVLPYTRVDDDFGTTDAPRWMVAGKNDLEHLGDFLRSIAAEQDNDKRLLDHVDIGAIVDIINTPMLSQRDLIGEAAEREDIAEHLTQQQAVILTAAQYIPRLEVRGGAGSGKTWLAIEQARRLGHAGKRVALICYSRGLAAWMERRVSGFTHKERPGYVGTFHGLGVEWGAERGSDLDSDFWERRLPAQMVELGHALPDGKRFDAIVIDEAQDFADSWWPAVEAALKSDDSGLYVFSDEGQRVFSRFGGAPPDLVPLVLDHNLRNTRQIAATFSELAPIKMRLGQLDGPEVELVECASDDALRMADDQVDLLMDSGWRCQDIAVLATGSRHPEQTARQEDGPEAYWNSFWDKEQVFYGHVLGFKGLERRAIVLAVNDSVQRDRARERLYVGLSRARDQLVVCGDPDYIAEVGGPSVLRRLLGGV